MEKAGSEKLSVVQKNIILFVAYVITAKAGLSLYAIHGFASFVWPSSGIAMAALFLFGLELWPAIFLGAFLVNASAGAPVLTALSIGCGNTLEAVIGTMILRHFNYRASVARLQDSLSIIIGGAFAATLVSATIGVFSLALSGVITTGGISEAWSAWWIGDMLGVLVMTPFLTKWISKPRFKRTLEQWIEGAVLFLILIFVSACAFWDVLAPFTSFPFIYLTFIPLIWCALRAGPRAMTLAIIVTAAASVSGTSLGIGPFASLSIPEGLMYQQLFIGAIAVIFLILTTIVEERKEAGIALNERTKNLEIALAKVRADDEAKNEFLAVLAHELRNPLSPILSAVEFINMNGGNTEELPDMMRTVEDRVKTMSRLLDDLLDISRISRKQFELRKEPVLLAEVMTRAKKTVGSLCTQKHHTLSISLPKQDTYLNADPIRLEQIFVNLLNNAAKYTNDGGMITVIGSVEHGRLVVTVEDNGIGIPERSLQRIFEPFYQVRTHATNSGGIGIGLSLTERLVSMHDGQIQVMSREGVGSTFTVTLPISKQKPMDKKRTRRTNKKMSGVSILVVDDNEPAAEALAKLLEFKGYRVDTAHSGEAALERADGSHNIVILDIGLPDMSGYQVAEALKKKHVESRLVALTGYGQEDDKQQAKDAGFDEHLTKPIGLADLEAVFGRLTDSK